MKIEIEIPDTTICGFVNYVFQGEQGLLIGTTAIDSEMVKSKSVTCKQERDP